MSTPQEKNKTDSDMFWNNSCHWDLEEDLDGDYDKDLLESESFLQVFKDLEQEWTQILACLEKEESIEN